MADDIELRRLWPDGSVTTAQIGHAVGKNKNAVIGRAGRLKLGNRFGLVGYCIGGHKRRGPRQADRASRPKGKPLARPQPSARLHAAHALPLAPIPAHEPSLPRVRGVGDASLGTACTIIEIGPAGCRWPVSQDDDGIHIFCGCHRTEESSYCPDHLIMNSGPTFQWGYGSTKFGVSS